MNESQNNRDSRSSVSKPRNTRRSSNPSGETSQERAWRRNLGTKNRGEKTLKIIPLGGLNEVGKNCTAIEYGNDIIVVDMGTGFAKDDALGADLIVPDISYLRENKSKVRGVLLTHGHLDHINAIGYLYEDIKDFDFFASPLTQRLVMSSVQERVARSAKMKFTTVKAGSKIKLGVFTVEFVHVNHSIPESMSLLIDTPDGLIYHSGDYKVDFTPVNEKPFDLTRIAEAGKQGVKIALMDSTNAEVPGHSRSESEVGTAFYPVIQKAKGRVLIASFASQVGRVQQVIDVSYELGKRVVIDGRSMVNYMDIAKDLKLLNIPKDAIISKQVASKLPDNKIVIMMTGSQGQEMSSLARVSRGEHKQFKIKPTDSVIISASPIPGNEVEIDRMRDGLSGLGATIYTNRMLDVHATGHGNQEDIKTVLSLLQPEYYVPFHGSRYMREANGKIAKSMGIDHNNVIMLEDGSVMEVQDGVPRVRAAGVQVEEVVVDGKSVGEISSVVVRERDVLGSEGFMTIILIVDGKTQKLLGNPDIISRGFVFLRDREGLVHNARAEVKKIFDSHAIVPNSDWDAGLKRRIRDQLGRFLYKETGKNPLIVPVVKIVKPS